MGQLGPKRLQEPTSTPKTSSLDPLPPSSWGPFWSYVGPCWSYVGTFELQVGSKKAILSSMKLKMAKHTPKMIQLGPT